jgi:hypothetical protein
VAVVLETAGTGKRFPVRRRNPVFESGDDPEPNTASGMSPVAPTLKDRKDEYP